MILGNKEINSLETFDKLLLNSDIIYYYILLLTCQDSTNFKIYRFLIYDKLENVELSM